MAKPTKTWKSFEKEIADMFGTKRNPLSGRNNYDDEGNRRIGDIIYPPAVVECKLYKKNAVVSRAKQTMEEASEKELPWLHAERLNGNKRIYVFAMPKEFAEKVVELFKKEVEQE